MQRHRVGRKSGYLRLRQRSSLLTLREKQLNAKRERDEGKSDQRRSSKASRIRS